MPVPEGRSRPQQYTPGQSRAFCPGPPSLLRLSRLRSWVIRLGQIVSVRTQPVDPLRPFTIKDKMSEALSRPDAGFHRFHGPPWNLQCRDHHRRRARKGAWAAWAAGHGEPQQSAQFAQVGRVEKRRPHGHHRREGLAWGSSQSKMPSAGSLGVLNWPAPSGMKNRRRKRTNG